MVSRKIPADFATKKSTFIDTSVIDFLQKFPMLIPSFIKKINQDFNIIYISEIVLHELLQGSDVNEALGRLDVVIEIQSQFNGRMILTKELAKILERERARLGILSQLPCHGPEKSLLILKGIKVEVLNGLDRRTIIYRNVGKDYSKMNQKLAKAFRARVISEKLDHSKEYKEFRGIRANGNHRILAKETKLSCSQFNKMVRCNLYPIHKAMLNLTNFHVLRSAVPKDVIANKSLAELQKNDSLDALILTEASMADAIITKDLGFLEVGNEVFKRGLIKTRTILIFEYLQIRPEDFCLKEQEKILVPELQL